MSGRIVEPGISIFTAAEIRVAVVPIGTFPPDIFEQYVALLNKFRHISLNAARSHYGEAQKSPFQHFPWDTGCLHFRFLLDEDARRRSKVVDLHMQRKVLALVGMVYCPQTANLQAAYQDFQRISKQFPDVMLARCFAFEPSEQVAQQDSKDLKDMVIFPPGNDEHLKMNVEVWMHDLAAAFLTEVEKWLLSASISSIRLNTYSDSGEFTNEAKVVEDFQKIRMQLQDEENKEKRKWGRLSKAKGDYCLLCGSPQDALEHYRGSQELARHVNDAVWFAAAIEGEVHSRVMEALILAPYRDGVAKPAQQEDMAETYGRAKWAVLRNGRLEAEVKERMAEARHVYRKKGGVVALQAEQWLKLARFVAGLRGGAGRQEVLEAVVAAVDLVPALHLPEDRAVVLADAAQVAGMVGCTRKRLSLLWQALDSCAALEKAEQLTLRIACRMLDPPEDPQGPDADEVPSVHWSQVSPLMYRTWPAVQVAVLEAVLGCARQARSPVDMWEAAAILLREHHRGLSQQQQQQLVEGLQSASPNLGLSARLRPGAGPGPLVYLRKVVPLAAVLQPQRMGTPQAGGHGPFIFNPFVAKRQIVTTPGIDWVCGEECMVEVEVINPSLATLTLERLAVTAKWKGPTATSPPSSKAKIVSGGTPLILQPNSRPIRVKMTVVPLEAGTLTITGCQVSMAGVQWAQPFPRKDRRRAAGSAPLTQVNGLSAPVAKLNLRDQDVVEVLPALPLLKVAIDGPQIHTSFPSEEEMQAGAQPSKKATVLPVFEGQMLRWTITLTNTGQAPVHLCQVVVSRGSRATQEPAWPCAAFRGVQVLVDTTQLAAALPLPRDGSVTLPVQVLVGRVPSDAPEEANVELRLAYAAELELGGEAKEPIGRKMVIPLQFSVQPMLKVVGVSFLEHFVGMQGAVALDPGLVQGEAPVDGPGAAPAVRLTLPPRGSSQATTLDPVGRTNSSRTTPFAGTRPQQPGHRCFISFDGSSGNDSTKSSSSAAGVLPQLQPGPCQLSMQPVLQLVVENVSDRYMRLSLGPLARDASIDTVAAAQDHSEVLQPGDRLDLLARLPSPAAAEPPPPPQLQRMPSQARRPPARGATDPAQLERQQCAEVVADSLGLFWQVITADSAAASPPQGMLRVAPGAVQQSMTSAALSRLQPGKLRFGFTATALDSALPCSLSDISAAAADMGAHLSHVVGPVLGLRVQCGDAVHLELQATNHGSAPVRITLSIGCSSPASCLDGIDPGVLVSGCYSGISLHLEPGETSSRHRFSVLLVRSGCYQLTVSDVLLEGPSGPAASGSFTSQGSTCITSSCCIDKFNLLCS